MTKKNDLKEIYKKIFTEAAEHMRTYDVQMVASTFMAIAMRLYKTHLTEEGFEEMMKAVRDAEVEPYYNKDEDDTIH
mgnify:CR=1 FL=1